MLVGKIYIKKDPLFSHARPVDELPALQKYEAFFLDTSLRENSGYVSIPFWYNSIKIELEDGTVLYQGIYPHDKLEPFLNGYEKEFQLIINNELQLFTVIIE